MQLTRPEATSPDPNSVSHRHAATPPPEVLLVSREPRWIARVGESVAAEGGNLETVPARVAVVRLARMRKPLSHVLVDVNAADGLLETLAALTSDTASPAVMLLLLGDTAAVAGAPRVIATADRHSIATALALRHMPPERAEPSLLPAELLDVISGDLIETRYQPITRIVDGVATAVEVLARLNHPLHGPVTPDWFVPRFEDAGLAFTLTDLVSSRALADLTGPSFQGLGLTMALNYPLKVLSHPRAANRLDNRRGLLGLTPEQVQIELTESAPVEDFEALGRSLELLRTMGYRVSIDDVGPGVRNLDRLVTLPFSGLKLDKHVVRVIGTSGADASFAPRVIEQARARGLNVVAEGVETPEMWDRVRDLGVQEAQGYLIARPLPAAAVPVWLEAWRAEHASS